MDPLRHHLGQITDPFGRLRQAKSFHALRVGFAVLVSIGLTTGLHLPHGDWATITVLVVIGGFQHHGNIRTRGVERAKGTLLGACIGLLLVAQQHYLSLPVITYVLMAFTCAYCAYYAIGAGGYVALLTGVTIVIAAGHGTNDLSEGVWRTINVLIGTLIALMFSLALPSYALHAWKMQLAQLLRRAGRLADALQAIDIDLVAVQSSTERLNTELIQLRSLMASAAKERFVGRSTFEDVQHSLRMCVCLLEMLATLRREEFHTLGQTSQIALPSPAGDAVRLQFDYLADAIDGDSTAPFNEASKRGCGTLADLHTSVVLFHQLAGELITLRARLYPILWGRSAAVPQSQS